MLSKLLQFVNPFGKLMVNGELRRTIKKHQADIILLIGIILISLLSFAIGYIVAKQESKEPIKFEQIKNEK